MVIMFASERYGPLVVSNMFDVNGDETRNIDKAASVVAQLPNGTWLATEVHLHELAKNRVN